MGWFMGAGAKAFSVLFGTIGFAALFLTTATLGFQKWELHKAGLRGEGEMMCTARYEESIKVAEREKAAAELKTANDIAENERSIAGGLRNELEKITGEYQSLAADAASKPSADPDRCLSDGVLARLRGAKSGAVEGKGKPAANEPYRGH